MRMQTAARVPQTPTESSMLASARAWTRERARGLTTFAAVRSFVKILAAGTRLPCGVRRR
jgi:hypothetical protein